MSLDSSIPNLPQQFYPSLLGWLSHLHFLTHELGKEDFHFLYCIIVLPERSHPCSITLELERIYYRSRAFCHLPLLSPPPL